MAADQAGQVMLVCINRLSHIFYLYMKCPHAHRMKLAHALEYSFTCSHHVLPCLADEAKAELSEALPALEAAIESLKALNKNDIVEIKSFTKPPLLVQMTLEAVCILKQEKPDWDTVSVLQHSMGCILLHKLLDSFAGPLDHASLHAA